MSSRTTRATQKNPFLRGKKKKSNKQDLNSSEHLLCISQVPEGPCTLRTSSADLQVCYASPWFSTFLSYSRDLPHTKFMLAAGQVLPSVPPSMSTLSIAALIEGSHWLVCRTGLKLHEVGTRVFTFWTWLCSRIHILPGSCSTQYIIHFF